ncbi:secreted RxLR effector protein 161-like [Elaeis guineensis]|uniref:secreted RxLR effector protein 161-like n=1 Tax=Elaeis guineensis var. tenera TaxID=51953 RepID=UPI003C6D84FB
MALAVHFDLELHQIDVKTAFLNGDLEEEVYMKQLEGFSYNDENIMDQCIYHKVSGSTICFLILYVDDILLATNDKGLLYEDCSPSVTPIVKGDRFSLNQCPRNDLEREQMQNIPYSSAVGSLMYTQVCTRLNIAFAIGMLGRYQSNPGMDHWRAAKKVMRYLKGTKNYMLMYRRSDELEVVGYFDSDFAGCIDSRKSTSEYIFIFASGAISWKSAKQTLIATSTMEAEFIAGFEATSHGV